ncbi:Sec-independent protein translocase subunit TatA [Planctomonas psychrotolerans]|uniref:Sec-independent protein translocase subunit TatA n=1 Tax=Planctomonas psychrotolerans TaxID=2528712 RepID=UPI00123C5287|nr:Sec-independent protein translocase subunit TatA [Planctomonas psychrotolerans]
MLGNLQGWHFIILVVVILLLFGAPKLPGLAKSLGQSMRIFKGEIKTMKEENNTDRPARSDGTTDEFPRNDTDRTSTDYVSRNSPNDPLNKP